MKNNKSRNRKNKKNERRIQMLLFSFVVLLVILGAFTLVMNWLTVPVEPPKTEKLSQEKQLFIETLAPYAQQLHHEYGVLPSIILGQAILESDWGRSSLAKKYKNLFGMKAAEGDQKVRLETKEFNDGKWLEIKADFKVYPNWEASMDDHTRLFVKGVSWNKDLYKNVIEAKDYHQAAAALQAAGYATDPSYEQKIIAVIETYGLARFDAY